MKLQLPCCEINKKSPNTQWECSFCECGFENADQRDAHNHEVHPQQLADKRKLKCCDSRKSKRQKFDNHQCRYCDCTFLNAAGCDYHMKDVHQCECGVIMLADDERTQHKVMHKKEAKMEKLQTERERQLGELEKQRQRKMDDDFILCYLKTNNLNEYRAQLNYQPDFRYIFGNHHFEKEELVQFVKKFKFKHLDYLRGWYYGLESDEMIYLVENGALFTDDVASFLDQSIIFLTNEMKKTFISYLLGKGYAIKPKWVAHVIGDDELIKRIKQSHTFTFNDIHEEMKGDIFFFFSLLVDEQATSKEFYEQVHKHFPDPNFGQKQAVRRGRQ